MPEEIEFKIKFLFVSVQIKMIKDEKLYEQIKMKAKKKFKSWPSAYASAWLVQEYKRQGGEYVGLKQIEKGKDKKSGISRWMAEKWINICKLPRKVPCGRKKIKRKSKDYPVCRQSVKINEKTPMIASKVSAMKRKQLCLEKSRSPTKRLNIKRQVSKSKKN
jgi:hypothetical protein